jgi:tetratricopeptide (TPR) repeat protein
MSEVEGVIESTKWIQTHISRVLLQLARGRRTGALHVTAAEVTQIVIVDGTVVFAEAEADTSLLFERLVTDGALEPISARRIERRVAEARGWSGIVRAAELVIQDARVAPNVLQQALLATIRARVSATFRLFEGQWIFRDDPRASGVPRYRVVLEATLVEALAESQTAARIRELLRGYGARFPRLEKESGVGTTKYLLTPGRYRVLRLVDGTRSFDEILQQSPLGPEEGASLIAAFTMLERIWWATERTAAPVHGDSAPVDRRQATIERAPTSIREAAGTPVVVSRSAIPLGRPPQPTPSAPVDVNELLRRLKPRTRSGETEIQAPTAQGHFDRGKAHFAGGRHPAASVEFEKAAALEPSNTNFALHARFLAFTLAGSAQRLELESTLLELAMKRVKEDRADAFALHVVGRLAFENDDNERALKAFKASERLAPQDTENARYLRLVAGRMKR